MKSNREKTTGIMGFVVSVLLHGIFFAGCIALDAGNFVPDNNADQTEINQVTDQDQNEKPKS